MQYSHVRILKIDNGETKMRMNFHNRLFDYHLISLGIIHMQFWMFYSWPFRNTVPHRRYNTGRGSCYTAPAMPQCQHAFQSRILKAKMWKLELTHTPDHIRPLLTLCDPGGGPEPILPTSWVLTLTDPRPPHWCHRAVLYRRCGAMWSVRYFSIPLYGLLATLSSSDIASSPLLGSNSRHGKIQLIPQYMVYHNIPYWVAVGEICHN